MDIGMYNSYLEVNFGKMKESFRKVQAAAGKRGVIPVLKANAYGIGLIPMADFLVNTMQVDVMAVAQTSEGVLLRQGGFRKAVPHPSTPCPMQWKPICCCPFSTGKMPSGSTTKPKSRAKLPGCS